MLTLKVSANALPGYRLTGAHDLLAQRQLSLGQIGRIFSQRGRHVDEMLQLLAEDFPMSSAMAYSASASHWSSRSRYARIVSLSFLRVSRVPLRYSCTPHLERLGIHYVRSIFRIVVSCE